MGPNDELPRADEHRESEPSRAGDADTESIASSSARALEPGTIVGAFTIEALLGQGGMATVYRARQEEPRRLVALKVIRADRAANDTYRRRFLAERETLAALEHPAIVPIYAAGESDGVLYLAMRLVDGPDLQSRIAREGRLALQETVRVLEPIADAVDYAHRMGVLHRDLKPSNIILDRDGRPYLTDFGLGKWLDVDSQVSLPGYAIGTLDYMAPEQFSGPAAADRAPAIDLYALGCVAFTCLTGRPPFVRDTPQRLMYAHAHEPPPAVRSLRPELPPGIEAIFARVLAKEPGARFVSARAFVSALASVAGQAAAMPPAAAGGGPSTAVLATPPVAAPPVAASPVAAPPVAAPPVAPPPAHVPSPVQPPRPAPPRGRPPSRGRSGLVTGAAVGVAAAAILALAANLGLPGPAPSPTRGGAASQPRSATPRPPTAPPTPPPTAPPTAVPNPFPNEAEAALLALQPGDLVATDACERWEEAYEGAVAMIICPGPEPANEDQPTFFALYDDVAALTSDYDGIMANSEVPDETDSACQDLEASNHGWSYLNNGGNPGRQQGWLGCFARTDTGEAMVQYAWTHEELLVLGLWQAPDYGTGLDYFDAWASAVQP